MLGFLEAHQPHGFRDLGLGSLPRVVDIRLCRHDLGGAGPDTHEPEQVDGQPQYAGQILGLDVSLDPALCPYRLLAERVGLGDLDDHAVLWEPVNVVLSPVLPEARLFVGVLADEVGPYDDEPVLLGELLQFLEGYPFAFGRGADWACTCLRISSSVIGGNFLIRSSEFFKPSATRKVRTFCASGVSIDDSDGFGFIGLLVRPFLGLGVRFRGCGC